MDKKGFNNIIQPSWKSEMEQIKKILRKDEKILWQRVVNKDLIKQLKTDFKIIVTFTTICIIILGIFILGYILRGNWLIFPFDIIAIVFIPYPLYKVFVSKRRRKNLKEKFQELNLNPREFKEIHLITNKRYIIRTIDVYSDDLEPNFIDDELDKYKAVLIFEEVYYGFICFCKEYETKSNPISSDYHIKVTRNEEQEILKILKDIKPIKKEGYDENAKIRYIHFY